MWRSVSVDIEVKERAEKRNLIIKSWTENANHFILLSDFELFWKEILDTNTLGSRCKQLNPLIEATEQQLCKQVMNLVNGSKNCVLKLQGTSPEMETMCLRAECKLSGIPFRFEFHLSAADRSIIFKELTSPLVYMVLELQSRQEHLYNLLKKKDVEIAEYKMNGGQLFRKNIETEEFDETQFERRRSFFGVLDMPMGNIFEGTSRDLYSKITKSLEHKKLNSVKSEVPVKEEKVEDVSHGVNGFSEVTSNSVSNNTHNRPTDTPVMQLMAVKQEEHEQPDKKEEIVNCPNPVPYKKPKKDSKKKLGL